jgi:hypothetical protein
LSDTHGRTRARTTLRGLQREIDEVGSARQEREREGVVFGREGRRSGSAASCLAASSLEPHVTQTGDSQKTGERKKIILDGG